MTRGIVYVVWGQKHINEAIVSARLNKSGYPTCLITCDSSDSSDEQAVAAALQPHFNHVRVISFARYDAVRPACIWWRKQASLIESPFDVTCYVDSDCFIQGNIDLGFDLAEEGKFCTVMAPTYTFIEAGREYILSNGGIWFAQTPDTELVETFFALAPHIQYGGDEGVISVAIRRGLPHSYLPESFNMCRAGQGPPLPIRVLHSRHPVGDPPTQILFDHFGNRFLLN